MSKAELKAIWGTSFGRCRDCLRETWYFNYRPFTPQGAGVTFKRGRVVQVFEPDLEKLHKRVLALMRLPASAFRLKP